MQALSFDRNKLFVASCLALLVTSLSFGIRAGILNQLGVEFHLNAQQLGIITATAFWGFPLAIVIGGMVVDIIGMKRLLLLAFIFHLLGIVLTIFATGFWSLFISTLLYNRRERGRARGRCSRPGSTPALAPRSIYDGPPARVPEPTISPDDGPWWGMPPPGGPRARTTMARHLRISCPHCHRSGLRLRPRTPGQPRPVQTMRGGVRHRRRTRDRRGRRTRGRRGRIAAAFGVRDGRRAGPAPDDVRGRARATRGAGERPHEASGSGHGVGPCGVRPPAGAPVVGGFGGGGAARSCRRRGRGWQAWRGRRRSRRRGCRRSRRCGRGWRGSWRPWPRGRAHRPRAGGGEVSGGGAVASGGGGGAWAGGGHMRRSRPRNGSPRRGRSSRRGDRPSSTGWPSAMRAHGAARPPPRGAGGPRGGARAGLRPGCAARAGTGRACATGGRARRPPRERRPRRRALGRPRACGRPGARRTGCGE